MKIRLENVLVDFLSKTLHIMLCSESSGTICTIYSLIDHYPMFSFSKARSSEAMKSYFRQVPAWHCLILDSRCNFCDDFFLAVKEFPLWVPVIMLADYVSEGSMRMHGLSVSRDSIHDVRNLVLYDNPSHRATLYLDNKRIIVSPLRSFRQLYPVIHRESITKKLVQKLMPEGLIRMAMDILFTQNPVTVEEWSSIIDSTSRKFQRMFKNYTFFSPKKFIALYHAYRIAFETAGREKDYTKGIISAYIMDERSKKRLLEYVLTRRSQLLSVE
jgi:hypothetical protein